MYDRDIETTGLFPSPRAFLSKHVDYFADRPDLIDQLATFVSSSASLCERRAHVTNGSRSCPRDGTFVCAAVRSGSISLNCGGAWVAGEYDVVGVTCAGFERA